MNALPKLRPYQQAVVKAVLRSAFAGDGLSFSVMFARQGGKNEVSAQLELTRLLADAKTGGESIKTAPTFDPQLGTSMRRLDSCIAAVGLDSQREMVKHDGDNGIRIGLATQRFLSCEENANVVGATCSRLLEADETQDLDANKFDREFRPMAATTNATTIFYGTAWDESSYLTRVRDEHLELERKDGIRRHFNVTWDEIAKYNPRYKTYVEHERARLGEDHPIFQTQYLLKDLPGAGRMLKQAALDLLQGSHDRLEGRPEGEPRGTVYAAGLDIGGEATGSGRENDSSVLAIGRVSYPTAQAAAHEPAIDVVTLYSWQGVNQTELVRTVLHLLRDVWRVRTLSIDAGGVGEGAAAALDTTPGLTFEIHRLRFTEAIKSSLGYGLQAAALSGRLRLFGERNPERELALDQAKKARARYATNKTMHWSVPESEGHDDHLMSLALLVEAAGTATPRTAQGRRGESEDQDG